MHMEIADQLGSGTRSQEDCNFIAVSEELCNPAGVEGWYLVISKHLILLPSRCHPQAYGYFSINPVVVAEEVM